MTTVPIKSRKKLIEVALPLDAINVASAREKSIRHGHPSTLHLWWARRPLAAARAVIFAQMVNDPGGERGYFAGMTKAQAQAKREELFKIIEDLVQWENTNNESVLERARAAIRESWVETCRLNKGHPQAAELFNPDKLPAFHDPFAGGGALPLETQRLGLESWASDLNPVAVTINKAMIEIPPKFAGRAPVGPRLEGDKQGKFGEDWSGARGLAEDVRRYGAWMRAEAEKRIGHLYPKIEVTAEMVAERPDLKPYLGEKLTVIAWLWARTVKSPNPAFADVDVPLASTFVLSSKEGKQAYVQPVVEGGDYRFTVRVGEPTDVARLGTKAGKAQDFVCLMSGTPIPREYIRREGKAGRLGTRLMSVVAEARRGRIYLPPPEEHERVAEQSSTLIDLQAAKQGFLSGSTPTRAMITGGVCSAYGLSSWGHLFTERQLLGLITFSELVAEAVDKCRDDAIAAGMSGDARDLEAQGIGAIAYAQAVGTFLGLAVSRLSDAMNSLCQWGPSADQTQHLFRRQAIPMVWDFAESSAFSNAAGDLVTTIGSMCRVLEKLDTRAAGFVEQADAQSQNASLAKVVSTDPPYYDNIGYADLSDFFYVWLRKSLKPIYPGLYATLAVPKAEELVATPHRHGSKEKAETF